MFGIALMGIALMGIVTKVFDLAIDVEYMLYDLWIGVIGGIMEAFISFPVVGSILDSIWSLIV